MKKIPPAIVRIRNMVGGEGEKSSSDINFIKGSDMHKYKLIVFWSEEDERFTVEVPELPECMADGETYEEAVGNAQVVISEWIETAKSLGREIPQSKGRLAYD